MDPLYIVIAVLFLGSVAINYRSWKMIVGSVVSGTLLVSVFAIGEIFSHEPKPPVQHEDLPKVEILDPPKLPPEEQEAPDPNEQQAPPQDFAPPMQQDVPQMATDSSFVQQLQPPPPENVQVNKSAIIIPQNTGNWAKGIGEIFDLSKLDQIPQPTIRVKPQYPFEMRRAGIQGQVLVDFIVDSNGDVRNAFAASSTQREFEQAAVVAVSRWKFRPGKKGGRTVNTHMQIPIVFSLESEE